jgi:hypothetical protein
VNYYEPLALSKRFGARKTDGRTNGGYTMLMFSSIVYEISMIKKALKSMINLNS